MDVTVCVSTFGSDEWDMKGKQAVDKVRLYGAKGSSLHLRGENYSLCEARNLSLQFVETEYVIFLDADDSLEITYIEEMAKGTADVRVPSVRYIQNGVKGPSHIPTVSACSHQDEPCQSECLLRGNYIVIGAAVLTEAVRAIGGFRDWPMYEDWDLWLRMYLAGYRFENIPSAVYLATVNPNSRNRAPSRAEKEQIHKEIANANGL